MIKIRPSGNIVIITTNWCFKFPWRLHGYRENAIDQRNVETAKRDDFFLKFIPQGKSYDGLIKTERLYPLDPTKSGPLLDNYFEAAFSTAENWPEMTLKELIPFSALSTFLSITTNNSLTEKILSMCHAIKIPESSMHGDFHFENIFLDKEQKIKFIDWVRYNPKSSRYFDLIDYSVFQHKKSGESWFDSWITLFEQNFRFINNIEVKNDHLIAYAIWKISEELKTLAERKALNRYKIKKYRVFIQIISKKWRPQI